MSEIMAVVAAVIAALAWLLGWEKRKGKKKDLIIQKQAQVIEKEKKQSEVYKLNIQTAAETKEKLEEVEQEQQVVEQEIKEAETDEEIIDIANSIVADFNRVSNGSKK